MLSSGLGIEGWQFVLGHDSGNMYSKRKMQNKEKIAIILHCRLYKQAQHGHMNAGYRSASPLRDGWAGR